jgi:hypothetical protein
MLYNRFMAGRPTIYTDQLAAQICLLLSEGESLRSVCARPEMPSRSAVLDWIAANEAFASQYARARDHGLDVMADEVMEIADDGSGDYVTRFRQDGKEYEAVDQEHIARSRLRFDARRWYLSKLAPKRYGDRIEQQITGTGPGGSINLIINPVKTGDDSK